MIDSKLKRKQIIVCLVLTVLLFWQSLGALPPVNIKWIYPLI